jgi:mono/diheme cytochrome c family protein
MLMKRRVSAAHLFLTTTFVVAMVPSLASAGMEEAKAFYAQKCGVCHSLAGKAGKLAQLGGPLDGVATKHNEEWFRAYLKDPKSESPNSKMPKVAMTKQQFDDIVAYLLTLTKPAPQE